MDKETLIIKESMKKLIKQNTETNEQLKKLNKPKTLQESTQENAGEILSGILIGAMDRKAEEAIAKGHNLGVGVSAKNGIDIVPGGEPSVNEADTLFGITKAFYNNFNFGDLIKSTLQVPKLFRQELETMQKNMKTTYNPFEDPGVLLLTKKNQFVEGMKKFMDSLHLGFSTTKAFLGKLKNFFTTFEDDGFMAGFVEGIGFKGLGKKISKFFSMDGMKISANLIGKKIGGAIKGMTMFIFNGIKKLGNIILSPLKGILKGIIGLPKKILGFFGGALDIIGRLLFLGGGIFALSKLSEFLRNVSPEGRKKFIKAMVEGTKKLLAALEIIKDYFLDVVLPVLKMFASALFSTAKFIAKFTGSYKEGSVEKLSNEIKDVYEKKGIDITEEQAIAMAQNDVALERARLTKDFLENKVGKEEFITKMPGASPYTAGGLIMKKYEKSDLELFLRKKGFGQPESTLFGVDIPKFNQNLLLDEKIKLKEIKLKEEIDKLGDARKSINAGISVAQVDNSSTFTNDRVAISFGGNPINFHV
jgi:hypothetical protein